MCGIYGWQMAKGQTLTTYQQTILAITLAEEMETRGRDSFGGALWHSHDQLEPTVIKALGKITTKGQELLEQSTTAVQAIVHTRLATVGAISIDNCHPFDISGTIGVHNGSVHNYRELNKKYDRDFQVDSMHLIAHIAEGKDTAELDAQGATAFAQRADQCSRIWYGRSPSGSLEVAKLTRPGDPKTTVMTIFASTAFAVSRAAERLGMDYTSVLVTPERFFYLEGGSPFTPTPMVRFPFDVTFVQYNRHRGSVTPSMTSGGTGGTTGTSSSANATVVDNDDSKIVFAYPVQKNVLPNARFTRHYAPGAAGSYSLLCPDPSCRHDLHKHAWGMCYEKGCGNPSVCSVGVPLCTDCGCYMLETIHSTFGSHGVFCDQCMESCVNGNTPGKKERRNVRKHIKSFRDATNLTEDEKRAIVVSFFAHKTGNNEKDNTEDEKDDKPVKKSGWDCPRCGERSNILSSNRDGTRDERCYKCRNASKCTKCRFTELATQESLRTGICETCREAARREAPVDAETAPLVELAPITDDGDNDSGNEYMLCGWCKKYPLACKASVKALKCGRCRYNELQKDLEYVPMASRDLVQWGNEEAALVNECLAESTVLQEMRNVSPFTPNSAVGE